MSTRAQDVWAAAHGGLLHEPTTKRVRVAHGGEVVASSDRAVLVWEPRRVVASYAVPLADVVAELVDDTSPTAADDGRPILSPSTPFAVHTTPGRSLTVRTAAGDRVAAAFRPADADLAEHVVLDFFSFDEWSEEDERIVGHPRNPFSRVDVRASSRHVRVEVDGHVLAESDRPVLVFETGLPRRAYLPRGDVRMDLLTPTTTRTTCAYKGEASYWRLELDGRTLEDVAWSYATPLSDAASLVGLVAFFDERVDVVVDGVRQARPSTEFDDPGFEQGTRR